MNPLFRGRISARKIARSPFKPRLEMLGDRIVPSAPTITSLSGEIIGNTIVVYGQESDASSGQSSSSGTENSSADTVTISGAINQSIAVNNTGEFTFAAPYSGNGNVVVSAQDAVGDQSGNYTLSVTSTSNPAPVITLQVINSSGGSATLSGTVYDSNPSGLAVTLSGAISATVTTDSQGNFSLTVQPNEVGTVYAYTEDGNGSLSNTAEIVIAQPPPTIQGLNWVPIDNGQYKFTGQVVGAYVPGSLVTLSSQVPGVNGAQGTVGSDGTFTIIATVPSNSGGGGTVT